MRKSTYVLVLLVVFEALIIGVAGYSIWQVRSGAWGNQHEELPKRIGSTAAILIPLIGAAMISIYAWLRASEK